MFTQEELTKFRNDMLNMCDELDVEVSPWFNSCVLNSKYVEKTLESHRCETIDELIKFIGNYLIEHPDDSVIKYSLKCNSDFFLVQGRLKRAI